MACYGSSCCPSCSGSCHTNGSSCKTCCGNCACGCSSCSSCGCSSNSGCSSCSGCSNGCGSSSGCENGCGSTCTYTRLSVSVPGSGVCRVCNAGIQVNSTQTALIGSRYVTSIRYTATIDYVDSCGCRRTASTTQTTQVFLPCGCTNFNQVCARVIRRSYQHSCCGGAISAILQICCR